MSPRSQRVDRAEPGRMARLFQVPAETASPETPSVEPVHAGEEAVEETLTARSRALSFVVPLRDEAGTLWDLYHGIAAAAGEVADQFEVVFVDDGSRDGSWRVIERLRGAWPARVRAIRLRRNLGKSAALRIGFAAAQGDVVFTLDADLQDEPSEIPRFLEALDGGYEVVSGWKKKRRDPWHKVLPSRVFNVALSLASGVRLHDHNCGFKCMRREVIESLNLMGEMHRMVPALAAMQGFRSTEIQVEHHPRREGRSKYGWTRFWRGACDLVTVAFLRSFRERPMHLIGGLAGGCAAAGLACAVLGGWQHFRGIAGLAPVAWFAGAGLLLVTSIQLTVLGLVSELMLRTRKATRRDHVVAEDASDVPSFDEQEETRGETRAA